MKEKYIKIEWIFQDDSVPRLVGVPDDKEEPSIDKEFLQSLEVNTGNRILRAYLYKPIPQFLVLAVGYLIGTRSYAAPSLMLALRSRIDLQEFASVGIIRTFACHSMNEIVYEAVRTAWIGYFKESNATIYFEEFGANPEQERISIIELLMNIISTVKMHIDYSESFIMDITQLSAN